MNWSVSPPLTPCLAQAAQTSFGASSQTTVLELLKSVGWMIVPLAVASVLTLALILVCLISLRRGNVVTRRFMETAEALLRKRDYLGLVAVSNRHSAAIARVTARTIDFATKHPSAPVAALRDIAETEGSRVASSLNQRIIYLADIATLAPMLGLLGTVIGIVESFSVLATNSSQPRQMLLAGGVGKALIATAAGLVIGIVAMTFYSYFRGRVSVMISDLESATTHILNLLSIQRSRRPEPTSVIESDDL